jgi:cell pole-organizing protein PopZ
MAQLNHEPSMEDILASIKRIIAEDSEASGARGMRIRREVSPPPAAHPEEDVVEPGTVAEAPAAASTVTAIHPAFANGASHAEPETGQDDDAHDVLELTSPLETEQDEAPAVAAAPAAVAAPAEPAIDETPVAAAPPTTADPEPAAAATATATPDPSSPTEATVHFDRLISDPAAQASRNAFAALSQLQVRTEEGQENTLQGLVADLLRPMLKDWLDRELPGLVERLVQDEIKRVSRG